MKKLCLPLLFTNLFLFISTLNLAFGQADPAPEKMHSGVWKVRPAQYGEYYISFENVKERDQTNEIGVGYIYQSFVKATDKDRGTYDGIYSGVIDEDEYALSECDGIVLRMNQRNYTDISKEAPHGFYHGPGFLYRFIAFKKDLLFEDGDTHAIGRLYQHTGGLHYQVGYQWLVKERLAIDLFGGIGARIKYASAQLAEGRIEPRMIAVYKTAPDNQATIGVAPTLLLNFSIGYAFY